MTIIEGKIGPKNKPDSAFYAILKLTRSIENKDYAIVNSRTIGFNKILNWETETNFSIEVKYKIGPDALLITEIC